MGTELNMLGFLFFIKMVRKKIPMYLPLILL